MRNPFRCPDLLVARADDAENKAETVGIHRGHPIAPPMQFWPWSRRDPNGGTAEPTREQRDCRALALWPSPLATMTLPPAILRTVYVLRLGGARIWRARRRVALAMAILSALPF